MIILAQAPVVHSHIPSSLALARLPLNRPLPSSKNFLFQNEARCTMFLVRISFICMSKKKKMISIWKAEDLPSFWKRGPGELGNGLFPHIWHARTKDNRPFQGCPKPLPQSELKKERFCTRFESEGFCNSEMAYPEGLCSLKLEQILWKRL